MIKRFFRPETGFFLGLLFFLLVVGRSSLFRDPGTFWHVVVGQRVFTAGFFDADPFSYTRGGQTWVVYEWLAECTMAAFYDAAGFDGLLLYTAVILAGTFALIGGRMVGAGFHWLPAVMFIVLLIGVSAHHFHARPHILTIALLAWTFARLIDVEAGRASLLSLWWLVPIFVLWTNWHGGMLGGLATLLLTTTGWIVAKWLGWPTPITNNRQALTVIGIQAACAATALVTPYGYRLPLMWWDIMKADLPTMIVEHRPLDFLSSEGVANVLLCLAYGASLFGIWPRHKPRVTWLVPLFWMWQSWSRMRHAPLFAVTAALAMVEILPRTRWLESLAQSDSDLFRPPVHATPDSQGSTFGSILTQLLFPAAIVLAILGVQCAGWQVPLVGRGWAKPNPAYWPFELEGELRKAAADPQTRLFNELAFGGFVIMKAPGLLVFIDDRCELYPDLLPRYVDTLRTDPATRARQMEIWAKEYGLNLALTHGPKAATDELGRPFDDYFRSPEAEALGWYVVRESTAATLFARRSKSISTPRSEASPGTGSQPP